MHACMRHSMYPPFCKMDGGSPSNSIARECQHERLGSTCNAHAWDGRENTATEVDRSFFELRETREGGAELADEVERLTDHQTSAAQTTLPLTPPHSSEQELAGVEEESVEARQSSREPVQGELQ